jgi:hypothetical protein
VSADDAADDLDIEAYALLQMRLGRGDRASVLAEHGLTEDAYEALDERVQSALSRAIDESDEAGVPPLIARYDAALKKAHEGLEPPLDLERFAEATLVMRRGGDPTKALAKIGIALHDYFRSSPIWAMRLSKDDALARRFAELMR